MKTTQHGFTLIELLVVIAIMGILSSIAVPQYSEYKKRAYDSVAQSDIRNLVTAQEAYYLENSKYANTIENLTTFKSSKNVTIDLSTGSDESGQSWKVSANHLNGTTNKKFCYDSTTDTSITEC